MKLISLAAGVVLLAVLGVWFPRDSETSKAADEATSAPVTSDSRVPDELERDRTAQPQVTGRPFEMDPDRLMYDRGYVNDPGVQALAKAHGIPPACLIALAKYSLHQVLPEPGVCPDPDDAVDFPV